MRRVVAALLLALSAASCSAESGTNDDRDPYEVYLDIAPSDAPSLSREDAQARALLGCGQSWAPGTVDAALQEAYEPDC